MPARPILPARPFMPLRSAMALRPAPARPARSVGLIALALAASIGPFCSACSSTEGSGEWSSGADQPLDAGYDPMALPHKVDTLLLDWHDPARGRDVPVKLYLPRGVKGERPLLIFSHGGGGSREGGTYLNTHLAARGWIVIAVEHHGSNGQSLRDQAAGGGGGGGGGEGRRGRLRDLPAQLRNAGPTLRAQIEDPSNLENRPRDVSFVIDRVLAGEGLPAGLRADAARIGVMGHSFGAYTTMATAGMAIDIGPAQDRSFRDPRVGAALALSPQGKGTMGINAGAWDRVQPPVMMMTGTKDGGHDGEDWTWRREGFEALSHRPMEEPAYFFLIDDATHMSFGDERGGLLGRLGRRGGGGGGEGNQRDPRHHGWIQAAATAFFDSTLLGNQSARAWLEGEGLRALVGQDATLTRAGG